MLRRILAAALLALHAHARAEPSGGILPVDPVELVAGRETKGEATIFVDRGDYRYVFIDEASKARFLSAPDRYEIQMGGACARMGPLSGRGRPDLYTVHDNLIYIFASESCKATFLKNADRMVESDDERPAFTDQDAARGEALLDQALAAHGGAERLDALRNIVLFSKSERETNAGVARLTSTLTLVFGEAIHKRDTWDDYVWGFVATPGDAFSYSKSGAESLSPAQVKALGRLAAANPIAILRARIHPDFSVGALPEGALGDTPVDRVRVWFHGFGATVSLDRDTHRVLAISCRDRGPSMLIGEVESRFSDFAETNGVLTPRRIDALFDGDPWPDRSGPVEFRVDAEIDRTALAREQPS